MEETLKILVVDDDEVDRLAVRRALKSAGFSVDLLEACDYSSAIVTLKEAEFDCVFLDYRLPDKDGLALVQDLRRQGIKIPLIVLTGQGDEQIAVDVMKAGATDYLSKSKVSADTLSYVLRNALRLYEAERAIELANQKRERLSREREDFVYRLTHDLRTPLVAADRMLTLFQQEAFGPTSSDMDEAIATMIQSNQNLLQMVNTILEVYRHDAGHKNLKFAPCDLSQIIRDVAQELSPLAADKGLKLTVNLAPEAGPKRVTTVMGDCMELRRLVSHLVNNAIKFTQKGSIEIRLIGAPIKSLSDADTSNAWVTIEVQDTGCGIPPADQKMLFERFRQGEGDNRRAGSGLGLYLARRIVEGHQGTIVVESQVGQGSLFTIRLPVQQPCDYRNGDGEQ
ncbi:MAG: hybrid sensor histidine kinase/response regulator [Leptolyngbyaceae cyanobacterium]